MSYQYVRKNGKSGLIAFLFFAGAKFKKSQEENIKNFREKFFEKVLTRDKN